MGVQHCRVIVKSLSLLRESDSCCASVCVCVRAHSRVNEGGVGCVLGGGVVVVGGIKLT